MVQQYLKSGGTLAELEEKRGIKSVLHDTLPLVILNYSQTESQKTDPIVRECRGLVLRTDNFNLVAKGFNRFFNWGEIQEEMKLFDFSDFTANTKEDGSLVLIYNLDGRWMANTRGSFGKFKLDYSEITWEEGFCKAMGLNDLQELSDHLDSDLCYVCEFCSPYNKVVRAYSTPKMYLLSVFEGEDELSVFETEAIAYKSLFHSVENYCFESIEEIQRFLQDKSAKDATFEGVVIRDKNNQRWKIKSPTYLSLHQLKGNNEFSPKYLVPFVVTGESAELLQYFPEVADKYKEVEDVVNDAYMVLEKLWYATWSIEDQKTFALAIVGKTPLTGILFNLRKKYGSKQTVRLLREAWKGSADMILKVLFK